MPQEKKKTVKKMVYPRMKPFKPTEWADAITVPSHPRHKAALMAASADRKYKVPRVAGKLWGR
jgi:hypothetical protein